MPCITRICVHFFGINYYITFWGITLWTAVELLFHFYWFHHLYRTHTHTCIQIETDRQGKKYFSNNLQFAWHMLLFSSAKLSTDMWINTAHDISSHHIATTTTVCENERTSSHTHIKKWNVFIDNAVYTIRLASTNSMMSYAHHTSN